MVQNCTSCHGTTFVFRISDALETRKQFKSRVITHRLIANDSPSIDLTPRKDAACSAAELPYRLDTSAKTRLHISIGYQANTQIFSRRPAVYRNHSNDDMVATLHSAIQPSNVAAAASQLRRQRICGEPIAPLYCRTHSVAPLTLTRCADCVFFCVRCIQRSLV